MRPSDAELSATLSESWRARLRRIWNYAARIAACKEILEAPSDAQGLCYHGRRRCSLSIVALANGAGPAILEAMDVGCLIRGPSALQPMQPQAGNAPLREHTKEASSNNSI